MKAITLISSQNLGYASLAGVAGFSYAAVVANKSAQDLWVIRENVTRNASGPGFQKTWEEQQAYNNADAAYSKSKDEFIRYASFAAVSAVVGLFAFDVVKL